MRATRTHARTRVGNWKGFPRVLGFASGGPRSGAARGNYINLYLASVSYYFLFRSLANFAQDFATGYDRANPAAAHPSVLAAPTRHSGSPTCACHSETDDRVTSDGAAAAAPSVSPALALGLAALAFPRKKETLPFASPLEVRSSCSFCDALEEATVSATECSITAATHPSTCSGHGANGLMGGHFQDKAEGRGDDFQGWQGLLAWAVRGVPRSVSEG